MISEFLKDLFASVDIFSRNLMNREKKKKKKKKKKMSFSILIPLGDFFPQTNE
jgi:hypothetical protein